MNHCRVISITNQKGGVAKTTTTVNLGAGLVRNGHRVLLIDADPQGSLTVSLGVKEPDYLDISLATVMQDVIEGRAFLADEGILHHREGMDLLPSNIELSGLETALFNVMSRETVLKNYIRMVRHQYDYILIDCMPSLGMMTVNALAAADSVIIPTQPSFLSAKGMDLLFRSIARVRRSINPDLAIDGILMTMVDARTNNAREVENALRNGIGQKVRIFQTQIPHSVRAVESTQEGKSIFAYDPKGKVAEAYGKLTEEVERIAEKSKLRSGDDRIR